MIMNSLYGGVCYAGIDTDPELKYPKGAGRVAFSNQKSYIAAISARFVQLQHGDIDKRVSAGERGEERERECVCVRDRDRGRERDEICKVGSQCNSMERERRARWRYFLGSNQLLSSINLSLMYCKAPPQKRIGIYLRST